MDFFLQGQHDEIAIELFNRLREICPSCSYTIWGKFLDSTTTSIACSEVQDEVVFRSRVKECANDVRMCNLYTHLEFFHDLSNAYLLVSGSVYLLDKTCPLYTTSPDSSECLSSGTSAGGIVGAMFGGLIAGAAISAGICLVIFIVVIKRGRRESEKDNPHPKTFKKASMRPKKVNNYTTKEEKKEEDDEDLDDYVDVEGGKFGDSSYEYLPTFKDKTMKDKAKGPDAEYDVPQDIMTGLPGGKLQNSGGYEYPDISGAKDASSSLEMQAKKASLKKPLQVGKGRKEGKGKVAKPQSAKKSGVKDVATKTASTIPKQPPGKASKPAEVAPSTAQPPVTAKPTTQQPAITNIPPPPPPAAPPVVTQQQPPATKTPPAAKTISTQQKPTMGQLPTAKTPLQPVAKTMPAQQKVSAKIPQPPPPLVEKEEETGFQAMRKKLANLSGATVVENTTATTAAPQQGGNKRM